MTAHRIKEFLGPYPKICYSNAYKYIDIDIDKFIYTE